MQISKRLALAGMLGVCQLIAANAEPATGNIASRLSDRINWFSTGDPLQTNMDTPPFIPTGYRDTAITSPCEAGINGNDMSRGNTAENYSQTLTLADVADASLCNNPQTREAWANARVQAALLGVAKSAYLPKVTDNVAANTNVASPQTSRNNPYSNISNNLVATYLLYDFGNRDANLENARQLLQAASATQSGTIQNILLSAVQAYYQVQAKQSALEAALEAESASAESFKAAEARYKTGIATPADKLQAQTAYAQQTLLRISNEGALKSAYGALANVMGLPANVRLNITQNDSAKPNTSADILQDVNALIEEAHIRRPDLIATEAQLKAAEASINASRNAAKPTISLALSNFSQDGSQYNASNTTALGISLSIPLFDGYAPTYKIRAAEANADLKLAQLDKVKLAVSLDVWNTYQALKTSTQTISAADILVNSAQESARVALGRYKAGVGNIIESLNAQSALASAQQQNIQARLNFNIARASLAQAIGILDNAMIQSLPDGKVQ